MNLDDKTRREVDAMSYLQLVQLPPDDPLMEGDSGEYIRNRIATINKWRGR